MVSSWQAAASSNIGGRLKQEDKVVSIPNLNAYIPVATELDRGIARSFFAVFDGHGGSAASTCLAKTFHVKLARSPLLASDPKAALLDVWQSMDGEVYRALAQKHRQNNLRPTIIGGAQETSGGASFPSGGASQFPRDGSTATVLLLVGKKLYAANCGDSAGVLVKKDGSVQTITNSHDTLNPGEYDRIRKLGGSYRNQTLRSPRKWPWCCVVQDVVVGKPRVCGLLVTRAFGDFSCKLGGTPGIILPDCEEILELTIEEDWAEVVIASDGVWDVMQTEEMPQILAMLEEKIPAKVSPRIPAAANKDFNSNNSSGGGTLAALDYAASERYLLGELSEEHIVTSFGDSARVRQAQLQGTCAKLVLACVRHRYWALHQAAADNASAVIVRFRTKPEQVPETCPEEASGDNP
ncbi:conserved unknown protein [Ectocarpus siliculosus]|uniref:protein-serine/threonine phosphatase n=1 Tax=Ectocarpus siliculosus TaxID=2880 RepID=D7FSM8_ECTSI|nr:conserved unknown protein [Ectocarpus siliculosus]|eukprot:CBJ31169.1 conserved unknown protein [Ectocarpus siliculosus]